MIQYSMDKRGGRSMKRFLLKLLILAVVCGAFFFVINWKFNSEYLKEQKQSGTGDKLIVDGDWIDVEKLSHQTKIGRVVDHELFFLLMGVDRAEFQGELTRSDTMMLVKIDFAKPSIDLISLPRDSRVLIGGDYDKLNSAHAYGGPELTIQSIRDWLNIDLDYYVKVDFKAVPEIVDAMGGVDFEIPNDGIQYKYYDENDDGQPFKPGMQRLNGMKALGFLRFRDGYDNGDIGRVEAQQTFMKAIVKQLLSSSNISNIPGYIKTYYENVETNISWDEILDMMGYISQLSDVELNTYTIPGVGEYIDDISYYVVDEEGAEELIKRILPNYIILDFESDGVKSKKFEHNDTETKDVEREELDLEEVESEEIEHEEVEPKVIEPKEPESKDTESKGDELKEPESKETEPKEDESKESEFKEVESEEKGE